VDVVVRRWETFTGLQATHAESGKSFAEMREERLTPPAPSVSTAQPVVQSVKLRKRPVAAGKAVNHA